MIMGQKVKNWLLKYYIRIKFSDNYELLEKKIEKQVECVFAAVLQINLSFEKLDVVPFIWEGKMW